MPFSATFRNGICGVIRSAADLTQIDPYCALFDGDPSGAGVEVTDDIDATGRKLITFGAPSGGIMSNSADVDFGLADAPADVTHFAIYDAATSGTLVAWAALIGGAEEVVTGNAVRFNIGDLTVNVT
jgi:hypothetical protein